MRAKRDAAALGTPLFLLQAADVSKPLMPLEVAKKLMKKANPKDTGGMHGFLPVHLGMRLRLVEALDTEKGLVKDAKGDVVHIAVHPEDQDTYDETLNLGAGMVCLRRPPLGIWLRMEKHSHAPFAKKLRQYDQRLAPEQTKHLVFVEPRTSDPFMFREFTVTRTGWALSHARVVTSTACQGRTMRQGVIINCGRHETGSTKKEDADWWLDSYVMLTQATRIDDLLLSRAPELSFFLKGPPKSLKKQLQGFACRTERCRKTALQLAGELGLDHVLRD